MYTDKVFNNNFYVKKSSLNWLKFNFEFSKCILWEYLKVTHPQLGRLFDKTGAIRNWWSAESEKNFREKEKCIIDQYNGYVVPEIGESVCIIPEYICP